ncbi:hypothetical protein [Glaciibacter flavus]|uniref:hypothetical protein n=1 Tax=Orlajensenia flava TaxID=2565934 RepID=UPI003B002482
MPHVWHPLLEADEPTPGVWVILDQYEREYARVSIVRPGTEFGYRAEARGRLVGYYLTLKTACFEAHMAYLSSNGPQGEGVWGLYRNTKEGPLPPPKR